jgi:hypothetical protein
MKLLYSLVKSFFNRNSHYNSCGIPKSKTGNTRKAIPKSFPFFIFCSHLAPAPVVFWVIFHIAPKISPAISNQNIINKIKVAFKRTIIQGFKSFSTDYLAVPCNRASCGGENLFFSHSDFDIPNKISSCTTG